MKVCINLLEQEKNIGPVIFAKRLAHELEKKNVKIVNRFQNHDVLLAIIKDDKIEYSRGKGAKIIQRLDGIYHYLDASPVERNVSIIDTFQKADAVVYQSRFNKRMIERDFGIKEQYFIIPNGADPEIFSKNNNQKNNITFLTSSKWRSMKRLDSIIEGFDYAEIPNSELWILGQVDNSVSSEKIKYFGEIYSKSVVDFYNNSDFLLHLAHADSCPNTVVEALVAEIPVICASSGGTKELIKNSGEIIEEKVSGLEKISTAEIPKIPPKKVAEAMYNCIENKDKYEFPREDLYISNCARNYIRAFEEVLDK